MIIRPRARGFICTTAHPTGCAANVREQIDFVAQKEIISGPANVLVIGGSTGYGLASRITAAFGCRAKTISVSLERAPTAKKTATAGWYNNVAFDREARNKGLFSTTINGDAFSNDIKEQSIEAVRSEMGTIDLMVYSLAAPVRTHPDTGKLHRSVIKPIENALRSRTLILDLETGTGNLQDIEIDPASEQETADTVAVMGGEDWQTWVDRLDAQNLLASHFKTVSYTYLGSELTYAIYRGGTIGRAKKDLDRSCIAINRSFDGTSRKAYVAVLKTVVTQASTAIPIVPLYFSILFSIMKEHGNYENCMAHIDRMFREELYGKSDMRVDSEGRIRMDNFELGEAVQTEVRRRWNAINDTNLSEMADIDGFREEFLRLFGFGIQGVDYEADVDPQFGTAL